CPPLLLTTRIGLCGGACLYPVGSSSQIAREGLTSNGTSALQQAVKNQLVIRNVSAMTERPGATKSDMQTFTMAQIAQKLLPSIADDRLFPAIFLAFSTGLRRGELLGLRWQDVDLAVGLLQVRQTVVRVKNHMGAEHTRKTSLIFQAPKTLQSRRTIPLPAAC